MTSRSLQLHREVGRLVGEGLELEVRVGQLAGDGGVLAAVRVRQRDVPDVGVDADAL